MPRSAIGIGVRVGGLRQGTVGRATGFWHRRPVDGGAHERVTERHCGADGQQSVRLGGGERLEPDPDSSCCGADQHRIAERLGGGDQQHQPGVGGERLDPTPEARLDPADEQRRIGYPETTSQVRTRQATRELEQGQRVASCLRDDPGHNGGSSGPWMTSPSSASASRPGSPETVSTGRPASSPLSSTSRAAKTKQHRLRLQAAAHERQRLRGRSIEPLAVVDQRDDRPLPAGLRQEVEDRQPDQEAIRSRTRRQPECRSKRFALRSGE